MKFDITIKDGLFREAYNRAVEHCPIENVPRQVEEDSEITALILLSWDENSYGNYYWVSESGTVDALCNTGGEPCNEFFSSLDEALCWLIDYNAWCDIKEV